MDIESLLVEYLSRSLDIPVSGDVPEDKPDRFVTLQRSGGGLDRIILDHPTAIIQCWAATRADAKTLALQVAQLIQEMPDGYVNVVAASVNSLYNFPSTQTRKPRYQIVADFTVQQ